MISTRQYNVALRDRIAQGKLTEEDKVYILKALDILEMQKLKREALFDKVHNNAYANGWRDGIDYILEQI